MRILLDECIPRKLRNELSDHECRTVPEVGFAGKQRKGRGCDPFCACSS